MAGLWRFLGILRFSFFMSKDIPQGKPVHWGGKYRASFNPLDRASYTKSS
jgi:hypothetical protein